MCQIRASNKELDMLRKGSMNTLDMVCRILARREHVLLFEAACWVYSATRESFGRWLT